MSIVKKLTLVITGVLVLSACASTQIKARKEQREKAVQSSHLYCEFINGEVYPDVDVALNLEMAKRCDPDGQMTLTGYRSPSEAIGLVYCCKTKTEGAAAAETTEKPEVKKEKK